MKNLLDAAAPVALLMVSLRSWGRDGTWKQIYIISLPNDFFKNGVILKIWTTLFLSQLRKDL